MNDYCMESIFVNLMSLFSLQANGLDKSCIKINGTQCPANYERCDPWTNTSTPTSVPTVETTTGGSTTLPPTTIPPITTLTPPTTISHTTSAAKTINDTGADNSTLLRGDNSSDSVTTPPPAGSIFCRPIEDEDVNLAVIIGGAVGGTFGIVVVLVVIFCCCRCCSGEPDASADVPLGIENGGRRRKRPISQLVWDKVGVLNFVTTFYSLSKFQFYPSHFLGAVGICVFSLKVNKKRTVPCGSLYNMTELDVM